MIPRLMAKQISQSAKTFPIVGIVGPRQSGKTTLARAQFPDYEYVNLEQPDVRRFAADDPRGFLARYNNHVILDEVQRVPDLFSYLQTQVDNRKENGQYILTGSQHFLMLGSISQSLAGRIALHTLYPLSYEELDRANMAPPDIDTQIWKGGYPRLYDQPVPPAQWLENYIQTYLDRDISLLSQITNLSVFEKFLRLSAGRTGQLLNLSSLGNETGVTHNTIRSWISLLETSGIIFFLRPYFVNIGKRLNKTPKMYFADTGLACRLLGITASQQLPNYPLFGSLFETFIVSEYIKYYANHAKPADSLYFFRDQQGKEADILVKDGQTTRLYEIKSAQTVPEEIFGALLKIQELVPGKTIANLIYGGEDFQKRNRGLVIGWRSLTKHLSSPDKPL